VSTKAKATVASFLFVFVLSIVCDVSRFVVVAVAVVVVVSCFTFFNLFMLYFHSCFQLFRTFSALSSQLTHTHTYNLSQLSHSSSHSLSASLPSLLSWPPTHALQRCKSIKCKCSPQLPLVSAIVIRAQIANCCN